MLLLIEGSLTSALVVEAVPYIGDVEEYWQWYTF